MLIFPTKFPRTRYWNPSSPTRHKRYVQRRNSSGLMCEMASPTTHFPSTHRHSSSFAPSHRGTPPAPFSFGICRAMPVIPSQAPFSWSGSGWESGWDWMEPSLAGPKPFGSNPPTWCQWALWMPLHRGLGQTVMNHAVLEMESAVPLGRCRKTFRDGVSGDNGGGLKIPRVRARGLRGRDATAQERLMSPAAWFALGQPRCRPVVSIGERSSPSRGPFHHWGFEVPRAVRRSVGTELKSCSGIFAGFSHCLSRSMDNRGRRENPARGGELWWSRP